MGVAIEFGRVYKRKELDTLKYSPNREGLPTIHIISSDVQSGEDQLSGVKVFASNTSEKPEDSTTMAETDTLMNGMHTVESRTTWICFELVDEDDEYEVYCEGMIPDVSDERENRFNEGEDLND